VRNHGCEKQTDGHCIASVKYRADGQYLRLGPGCEGETTTS